MNVKEHILTVIGEECQEIAKEVSKALRFGLQDKVTKDPYGPRGTEGPTNAEKIINELNDLLGVVQMLVSTGDLPENWIDYKKQQEKRVKVSSFMDYAETVGTLQE